MEQRTVRALERNPTVLKLSPTLFLVEASGEGSPKDWYEVDLDDWTCDCPDHRNRGEMCYHIRAAIIKEANCETHAI